MNTDRTKAGLQAFISAMTPDEPFGHLYPGTIINQRGSNSFDFQPDSPLVPGMAGIPIQNPTPGITFTVDTTKNPRALLGFQDKDPQRPVILLWEAPGLSSMTFDPQATINMGPASAPVGRVGDSVSVTIPMGALAIATTGTATSQTGTNSAPLTVTGTITAGSPKVNA